MNDQLCYEVDLDKYSDKNNVKNELELGFNFLMDYNEDRQVTFDQNISKIKVGLAESVASSDHNQHAFVYLDTIGMIFLQITNQIFKLKNCRNSSAHWRGRIQSQCSERDYGY